MSPMNGKLLQQERSKTRQKDESDQEATPRHVLKKRYQLLDVDELLLSNNEEQREYTGWDTYAGEYATAVAKNPIYQLSKIILYQIIEKYVVPRLQTARNKPITVLDFNCGTGNDFPYFLSKGWNIVGCDGSIGMLQKAARRFSKFLKTKRIILYQGKAECFHKDSLDNLKFDLIFSTTGSLSYVDDNQFARIHHAFRKILTKRGSILTAHLTPFSLGETLFFLLKGHPRMAFRRLKKTLRLEIKGAYYQMHLRSVIRLTHLLRPILPNMKIFPVLVLTPPFQAGFNGGKFLNAFRIIETKSLRMPPLSVIADQVAILYRNQGD